MVSSARPASKPASTRTNIRLMGASPRIRTMLERGLRLLGCVWLCWDTNPFLHTQAREPSTCSSAGRSKDSSGCIVGATSKTARSTWQFDMLNGLWLSLITNVRIRVRKTCMLQCLHWPPLFDAFIPMTMDSGAALAAGELHY